MSRSLQDYRDEITEKTYQLRRLGEERAQGIEQAARARGHARQQAQAEVAELREKLQTITDKVQRRTSELRACERKSVSLQIQAEELAAQLDAAQTRAGSEEANFWESLHKHTLDATELQDQVQEMQAKTREARAVRQAISIKLASSANKLVQMGREHQEKLHKDLEDRKSEINTEICEERDKKLAERLLHKQNLEHAYQELQATERAAAHDASDLEAVCTELQLQAETTRGRWLAAERLRFTVVDELADAAAARDHAASELRACRNAKSALLTKLSLHGHEFEQRVESELVLQRADRWHHSEEALQLHHQTKLKLDEHRRHYAAELREGLSAVAAKSRGQESRAEHRTDKRLREFKHMEELHVAHERQCLEEKLGALDREAMAKVAAQQSEEATLLRRAKCLREELARANHQTARWGDEEHALEAEWQGFYEEDLLQLQGQLRERSTDLRALRQQLGEDELAYSNERRQLLAEIQAERQRAAQSVAQPPRQVGIGITGGSCSIGIAGGGSNSSRRDGATGDDDPFEDLPELPSIPDIPPDFFDAGTLAGQSGHDESEVELSHDRDVARLHAELEDCASEKKRLIQAATTVGSQLSKLRETETHLSEAEADRAALRAHHERLEEEVSQERIVRDRLQDWDNELRDALCRTDASNDNAASLLGHTGAAPFNSTADTSSTSAQDEETSSNVGLGENSERIAELEEELRVCIEQNDRAKRALSMRLEQDRQDAEPLVMAGHAKDLSPARPLLGASERSTPSQRSSQRRLREMQMRVEGTRLARQQAHAGRDAQWADARLEEVRRRRVAWNLPPDAPSS